MNTGRSLFLRLLCDRCWTRVALIDRTFVPFFGWAITVRCTLVYAYTIWNIGSFLVLCNVSFVRCPPKMERDCLATASDPNKATWNLRAHMHMPALREHALSSHDHTQP